MADNSSNPVGMVDKIRCAGCNNTVTCEQPLVFAMNKVWHYGHFRCVKCRQSINDQFQTQLDGNGPYCIVCYAAKFYPTCAVCGEKILDKCVRALGGVYHPKCFVCWCCRKPFENGAYYYTLAAQPYDLRCYQANLPDA